MKVPTSVEKRVKALHYKICKAEKNVGRETAGACSEKAQKNDRAERVQRPASTFGAEEGDIAKVERAGRLEEKARQGRILDRRLMNLSG